MVDPLSVIGAFFGGIASIIGVSAQAKLQEKQLELAMREREKQTGVVSAEVQQLIQQQQQQIAALQETMTKMNEEYKKRIQEEQKQREQTLLIMVAVVVVVVLVVALKK